MTNEEAKANLEKLLLLYDDGMIDFRVIRESVKVAIDALQSSAELISWLDECISDEHTTPIEWATLTAVKCKAEEIAYGINKNFDKIVGDEDD